MNLERAINVMGWKMLGHSVHIPHEEQEKAARLIKAKLSAAEELHKAIEMDLAVVSNTVVLRYQQYEKAGTEDAKK